MGRKRKRDKDLPRRVYLRSGTFWRVDDSGKWHKLGRSRSEMYRALAAMAEPQNTLRSHMARYRAEVMPSKARSTQQTQERHLQTLESVFGDMAPAAVKTMHVAQFLDRYPSPTQANRHIALLSHVYTKLIRWGVVEANPCTGVERNKEQPRKRYVEDAEFWAVWELAPRHIRLLMELALITGQRQADLINLRWEQVDGNRISFEQAKTGKRLIIHSDALENVLERARRGVAGFYVIRQGSGRPYTSSAVQTAWQRLMQNYAGERFTFHDIRAKSASDHPTGKHLGHASESTLRRIYQRKPMEHEGL